MNVYIPVFLLIILFCVFIKGKNSADIKLILSLSLIFLMMAFRTRWGGDYDAYENWFDFFKGFSARELAQLTEEETRSEIGYRFLCYLCPSFRTVLIVYTLFFCVTLYCFFKEFIPEKFFPYTFALLFFDKHLLMGSSSIRTCIAVCFFLFAVISLSKNKKIGAAILIAIGALFHTGVLILYPIILFRNGPIKIRKDIIVIVSAILAVLSVLFANQIVAAADYLTSSIGVFNRYEEYLEEAVDTGLGLGIVFVIMEMVMLIPLIDISGKPGFDGKDYIVLKLAIVWISLMIMPSFGLSERLFFYLDYAILAAVPIVVRNCKNELMSMTFKYYLLIYYLWVFSHYLSDAHFVAAWLHYNF